MVWHGRIGRPCLASARKMLLTLAERLGVRLLLPGTQKLWEGVKLLSHAVICMRAMQEWDRNQSKGEKDTDLSV